MPLLYFLKPTSERVLRFPLNLQIFEDDRGELVVISDVSAVMLMPDQDLAYLFVVEAPATSLMVREEIPTVMQIWDEPTVHS